MYLTRGGFVTEYYGSLMRAGTDEIVWSHTGYLTSEDAFYLGFDNTSAYASSNNSRWFGFTVRDFIESVLIL